MAHVLDEDRAIEAAMSATNKASGEEGCLPSATFHTPMRVMSTRRRVARFSKAVVGGPSASGE